tara:strand:+ start:1168 stop:2721 length:1554 start_codon:yes stop_codon:yes gene_type:complete
MNTYYKDGASITIVGKGGWSSIEKPLSAIDIKNGLDSSMNKIEISGKSLVNKYVKIARVKVEADENKYFVISPNLKTRSSNIKLKQIASTKNTTTNISDSGVGNKFISYTYDLLYRASKKSDTLNEIDVKLLYKTESIPTVNLGIKNIIFGNKNIDRDGESRKIRIYGHEGTKFGVAINENLEEVVEYTTTDPSDGGVSRSVEHSYINKINDTSILSATGKNKKVLHNYGSYIKAVCGTIDSSGVFSFHQKFPSTTSQTTNVNGSAAASGAGAGTNIEFDDLTGVRVGDRIYSSNIPITTVVKVSAVDPDGDNVNECTLDATVTLADNAVVYFRRKRCYSIDVIPDQSTILSTGSNLPETDPTYRLYQYMNPVLTITNKMRDSNVIITHNDGTATSLGTAQDFALSSTGKANTIPNANQRQQNIKTKFTFDMLLDIQDGKNFTLTKRPIFSNTNQSASDWTNSVPADNGGTRVNIHSISNTAAGQNTINIKYKVEVLKWGNKDVTMELDLDTIVNDA